MIQSRDLAGVINKETVLLTWVQSGIRDFYLSYELESRWMTSSIFFCHQGLEKICKTYYLGECSLQNKGH